MPKQGQWLFVSDEMNAFHFPIYLYFLQSKCIFKAFFKRDMKRLWEQGIKTFDNLMKGHVSALSGNFP